MTHSTLSLLRLTLVSRSNLGGVGIATHLSGARNDTLPPVVARLTLLNRSNLGGVGDCHAEFTLSVEKILRFTQNDKTRMARNDKQKWGYKPDPE